MKRLLLFIAAAVLAGALPLRAAAVPEPIKIGFVYSYTGTDQENGKEADAAMAAYMAQHGDTVAGRKVVIIKRDDTGLAPEVARRLAQELVIQEHVDILAGSILTPDAIAVAQVSTQSHVPFLIVNAGSAGIPEKNPYTVRFGFTNAQLTQSLAQWMVRNGMKTAYALFANYGAGVETTTLFTKAFTAAGGTMLGQIAMPYNTNDFSAYIQRVKEAHPQALFVFHNGAGGINLMKSCGEAELTKAGITVVTAPEVVRANDLAVAGDSVIGNISALDYVASHDTAVNRAYVAAFQKAHGGDRLPGADALAAYDIMGAVYRVAAAQNGVMDPDKTMATLRGMSFESPRGPFKIDPQTREPIENIYIRRVERMDGALGYREIATFPMVKVPVEQ
jgi:branched-chain amino acid transport system substrate-binding protein